MQPPAPHNLDCKSRISKEQNLRLLWVHEGSTTEPSDLAKMNEELALLRSVGSRVLTTQTRVLATTCHCWPGCCLDMPIDGQMGCDMNDSVRWMAELWFQRSWISHEHTIATLGHQVETLAYCWGSKLSDWEFPSSQFCRWIYRHILFWSKQC